MKLVDDQIHAPAFQKLCTHIWSDNLDWSYTQSVVKEHNKNLKVVNETNLLDESGILYIGLSHLIEEVFQKIKVGRWIVIHRTNDRSFTEAMYQRKPDNVKLIYTVDCAAKHDDVFAIPIGFATIGGEDNIIKQIAKEVIQPAKTKIFVRYNVNDSGYTEERIKSIPILQSKSFAKVITEQIPTDEFYREIKAHEYTMSLRGCGADACRTWDAMALGSIPIVSDCVEMRHFEDMPIIFAPKDLSSITEEWLSEQDMFGKSTKRAHMSYWENHIRFNSLSL